MGEAMSSSSSPTRSGRVGLRRVAWPSAVVGLLLLVVALAAACSNAGTSTTTGSETPTTAATPTTAGTETTSGTESSETTAPTSASTGPKTIGIIGQTLDSPSVGKFLVQSQGEADKRGWKILTANGAGDMSKVAAAWQAYTSQKVDAIINYIVDNTQIAPQIKAAADAGIPVVSLYSGALVPGLLQEVGGNDFANGTIMGQYLVDYFGGEAKIVYLDWVDLLVTTARYEGVKTVFSKYPGMEILDVHALKVPGQVEDARTAMEAWLTKYPEIDAVIGGWDEPAMGALRAIDAAGRDVKVFGFDGTNIEFQTMRDNELYVATMATAQLCGGNAVIEALDQIFAGETIPRRVALPAYMVTREEAPADGLTPENKACWESAGQPTIPG